MRRFKIGLLVIAGLSTAWAAGCAKTDANPSTPPKLSAEDKAKMAEMTRKAQLGAMSDQINRSNLPADQKQRLLQQVNSSAGK